MTDMRATIPKTTLTIATLAAVLATPLAAQRITNISQGDAVRKAYAPTVEAANASVVTVHVNGERRVLGTCVGRDLVVTKYSELKAGDSDSDKATELTCKQGKLTWPATLIGFDRPCDLALLRLEKAKLKQVEWQARPPKTGAFLATPDGDKLPLGVGMLAAPPYQHTRARAFLGIRFANGEDEPAKLDQVVEHGAARAAGLLAGDTVVKFGDEDISESGALRASIGRRQPGDKVTIKVDRDGEILTFEAVLGTNNSPPSSGQEDVWGDLSAVRSGFQQVLQHDTILKPRDCGGPLVDLTGKVVGVNIARAGRVETLALPAATVQELVKKLLQAARGEQR